MSNICEQCGGVKTFSIEIQPVYSYANDGTKEMLPASIPFKICMCPLPKEKHDGKLPGGDTYEVYYDGAGKDAFLCIQGTHNLSNYEVVLEPKQALSLLAWLKQEEATLEQLVAEQAKEQAK